MSAWEFTETASSFQNVKLLGTKGMTSQTLNEIRWGEEIKTDRNHPGWLCIGEGKTHDFEKILSSSCGYEEIFCQEANLSCGHIVKLNGC